MRLAVVAAPEVGDLEVEILEGDTDQVPYGSGTFGSRSMAVGGSALDRAAMKVIEKGKRIAAHLLEAIQYRSLDRNLFQ